MDLAIWKMSLKYADRDDVPRSEESETLGEVPVWYDDITHVHRKKEINGVDTSSVERVIEVRLAFKIRKDDKFYFEDDNVPLKVETVEFKPIEELKNSTRRWKKLKTYHTKQVVYLK